VTVQDTFFIGDYPEADIIGTKNAGMMAIWKRSPHWMEAKEADAISEILADCDDVREKLK
jgi:putative hydrolase of the HAD superfamily